MILALALAMSLGAWAQQEVLLTTVTATGETSYSQSPDGIVTVTLNIGYYDDYQYGWLGGTVTVEAPQGYTITRCVFRQQNTASIEDDLAPFTATLSGYSTDNVSVETSNGHVNGDADHMIGITSIEVYGYAADPSPTVTHNADGSWTFTMPDYDAALNVTYYLQPALAWTLGGSAIPNDTTITAYYGFHQETMQKISFSMGNDFLTYITGLSSAEQTALFSLLVDSSSNPAVVAIGLQGPEVVGPGECDIYSIFRGNDDFLADTAAFHLTILDPDTLTLAANGNGTVSPLLGGGSATQFHTPANWFGQDLEYPTTEDLPGFLATTQAEAEALATGVSDNMAIVIYDRHSDGRWYYISRDNDSYSPHLTNLAKHAFYSFEEGGFAIYYTTATGGTDIVATDVEGQYLVIPGATVQVVAEAQDGNHVSAWSDNRQPQHYTSDTNTITVNETMTLTATFAQNPLLTLATDGQGSVELDGVTYDTEEQSESFTTNQSLYTYTGQNFTITCTHVGDGDGIQIAYNQPITITSTNGQNITRVEFHMTYGHDVISTISSTPGTVVGDGSGTEGNCSITDINATSVSFSSSHSGYVQINQITVYSASIVPVPPDGVTAGTTANTYRVLPGTEVNVTATPAEGSYLAQWSDGTQTEPVEGDARLGGSHPYTMPATQATLTATFNQIPVLTLASNNSEWGTVEMEGAGSGSSNGYTIKFSANGNTIVKENVTLPKTYQCEYGSPSEFDNIIRELYGWTGVHGNENAIPTVTGTDAITPGTESSRNYPKFTINSAFQGTATVTIGYTNSSWVSDNWPIEISFVPALPAGVLATTEEGVYNILPGTEVKVIATPDPAHYFVNWDEETALNSNTAVEKTLTMGTAAVELTANFAAKPTLTLAQNENWGTVSVNGPVVWNNQVWGSWDYFNATFPQTIGDITINKYNFYCYYSYGKLYLDRSVDNNSFVTFTSAGDNFTRIEMTYTGGSNLEPANEWTCANGVAVWEGNAQSVTITNATDFSITQIKFIRGSGIEQLTNNTYRVDYGTTVTVQADATDLHHVANWVNEDSVAYPAADITYSAYFVTTPENLFPAKSALTFTLTADTTARALFGINSYDVFATVATDNREEIGTGLPMGTVGASYVAQDGTPDQSVSPAANISYTAQGGSPSTLTATANYGYVFSGWQVGTETYNTATLTLTESATVTALFVPDTFTVSATPSIAGSATLSGTGRVAYRESTTLAATPETGYHFTEWTDAAATALGTEATLTVQALGDSSLVAVMDTNEYNVTYTVQTDDRDEIGTGLPMGTVVLAGRHMHFLNDVLEATAAYGYVFEGWYSNNELVSTANPYTFSPVSDSAFEARFVPDTFTVSATPSIAGSATLSGTGRVAYRESTTLAATPETGYHFTEWQNLAGTQLGTEATLTVQALGDSSLVAVMDTNEYNVTYTVQTDERTTIGTHLPMGSVVFEGRHMHFLYDTLTIEADYGYVFTGWYANDELVSIDNPFVFSPMSDTLYEARFVPDTFTVSLTMNDEHAGDVLPHGQLPAGVTVGPNVTYRVPYLVPMTFYGAAMEHNHIVNWINENDAEYVDGVTYSDYLVCDTFPTTSLLTLAVTGDTTVKINFLIDYYYVTVGLDEESTGRGTVTGSGYYDHGDTVTAMASPAEGYHFDGWDNGVEISPYAFAAVQDSTILVHFDTNVYSLTVVAETDTNTGLPMGSTIGSGLAKHFLYYDIEAVAEEGYHFVMWTDSVTDNPRTVTLTENTTFTAHFEMDPIVDVVINGVSADETMGTVSGSDTVDYGEEVILTATANEHYHFVQWNDGNSDNPRTVVAAHDSTLTAYFAVNQYAVVGVSADETMGTVSGSDTADYQSVVVLTATAGDCYHFESWSDGETANPRSIVAEADTTVSALFAANVYSMNDTVTVCDSYEWNGTVYTQSGTYTHDGTTAAGCDMLETLYLTVNASTTGIETVTACDSYEWHDSVYTASTDESTYQTTNAAGCDSTVTLHLTVNAATASEESETACNYYTWHGETYTVSGDYIYTTQNAAGCDSTVTLHLTVNYGNLISIDSTVCDSIVWRGNVYTESGVYDFDLPSESGCFSIETLNLTVNYSSSAVETIFACDSYTWNGLQFDADNHTATYLTVNAAGCDSTVTLDLTVHYSNSGSDYITACDSVEWHGTVYTASVDDVFYHGQNVAGCDSTVVLVLTINHSVSDTVEVTAEESYEWNGEVYSQSGTYTYSGTTEAGCDSTVTLLLTITYQPQPVYYTVTLVSADTTMGSVLPAEAMSVEEGSQFSATAIALYGRHFVAWERDGQVVSTDNPYSFEVTEDVELTATFAYNPVTVILSVNNANWGSTDPAPGTYTYEVGEQATVTATPAEGFHMMGWTINGTVIETDETTYTVEATPEMAGMTFSVVAMFVRDIAIDDVEDGNIAVYASEGKIVVSGAEHRDVYVYDVTGRCVSRQADAAETVVFPVAQTGVYMVKIGNLPARKVALVR